MCLQPQRRNGMSFWGESPGGKRLLCTDWLTADRRLHLSELRVDNGSGITVSQLSLRLQELILIGH